jgi:membrane associated rhomboid family serine protease
MGKEYKEVLKCYSCEHCYDFDDCFIKSIGHTVECQLCHNTMLICRSYEEIVPKTNLWHYFKKGFKSPTITIAYICCLVYFLSGFAFDKILALGAIDSGSPLELWRILTHGLLHAGFLHLLFNMIGLVSFGLHLEKHIGKKSFIKLYIWSTLSTALFWIVSGWGETHLAVGASGALFGVVGAYSMVFPNNKLLLFLIIPMRCKVFVYLAIVLSIFAYIYDKTSNVGHIAHLGGLVGGMLYMKYLMKKGVVHETE